jgi:glucokinase
MVAGVVERGVIGVDLGGTKLLAGAVDADLAVHHRTNRPVTGLDQDGLVQMVADAVEEVRTAVGGGIEAVGFGIPCTFDRRTGVAIQAVNAPLHDILFHEVMAERLGLPVVVDNDANCAALCEARVGVAAGCSDLVLLTLGTGIGGGLVLGGDVYRGWLGGGAEMGHMVVAMDGPPCQGNCPNHGCLESVASGTALVREASLAVARRPDTALGDALEAGRELTGPLITELARDGDPVAREAIELIGRRLGVGIASLVNIFNPEYVVIGGGVSAAGDLLLDPAREVMRERALSPNKDVVRIEAAAFGAEAGMIGAALMARDGTGIARAGTPAAPPAPGLTPASPPDPAGPDGSRSGRAGSPPDPAGPELAA